jgi:hypothetical protein
LDVASHLFVQAAAMLDKGSAFFRLQERNRAREIFLIKFRCIGARRILLHVSPCLFPRLANGGYCFGLHLESYVVETASLQVPHFLIGQSSAPRQVKGSRHVFSR